MTACAAAHPVPTQAMAKAAVELHLAEQAGARRTPDGARLCTASEEALQASRKLVGHGKNRESQVLAERGYNFARHAREQAAVASLATGQAPVVSLAARSQ